MKTLLKLISFAGLISMFIAAIMVFNDAMPRDRFFVWALAGTLAWFIPVPFWMKRRLHDHD